MSSVPIPQGATVDNAPTVAPTSVPIPQNAIVEQQAGKGVTNDSMDADYQFKHPALTDDEMKQLQDANLARPLYRKLLGLPANDKAAAALKEKAQAHESESAQHSSLVQDQLKTGAAGGALVVASPLAMPASVAGVGATARTIAAVGPPVARALASPAGQAIVKQGGKYALKSAEGLLTTYGAGKLGAALGIKWLQRLFD